MILCESARRSFQHGEVAIQTFCFMKCRIDTFNVGWPVRRSRDRADHQRPGVRWQTVAAVREHNLLNLGAGPWLVARTKQIWRLFKSHKSVKIQRFQPKLIMSNCPPITQRNGPKGSAQLYTIFLVRFWRVQIRTECWPCDRANTGVQECAGAAPIIYILVCSAGSQPHNPTSDSGFWLFKFNVIKRSYRCRFLQPVHGRVLRYHVKNS